MQTYLILGAGGFIGKALTKKISKFAKVIAFDQKNVDEFENNNNIEMICGDFTRMRNFDNLLKGVDIVYHFVCTTIPSESTDSIDVEIEENIIPTVRLLESMVKNNVNKIIFASSGGTVYGETGSHINQIDDQLNPICSYGVQKKVIEAYIDFYGLKYGMEYRIARMANPYGFSQNMNKPQGIIPIFINRVLEDKPITIYGDGTNERDFIYIKDLVTALIKLGSYEGSQNIFNIGTGRVYSLNEVIEFIAEITGKRDLHIIYEKPRTCDVTKTLLDVERTKIFLDWDCDVDIETGIRLVYDFYKK